MYWVYIVHGARGWAQKQVIKHCSIAPKDLDNQTRFVLKNSRNKFDWLVHEVLLFGELIMSNKKEIRAKLMLLNFTWLYFIFIQPTVSWQVILNLKN